MVRIVCTFLAVTLSLTAAFASEVQLRTNDGQTIQGEYLGTEDGIVKIRSKYGVLSVPTKDVLSLGKAPDPGAQSSGKPAVVDANTAPEQLFPTIPDKNITALMATRAPPAPEPTRAERTVLSIAVQNLKNSPPNLDAKYLAQLRQYGAKAYPFVASAYTDPLDLDVRVHMVSALAESDSPYTAGIFADTHATAWEVFNHALVEPPAPADNLIHVERVVVVGKREDLKTLAGQLLSIEAFASQAGGPFNTLFLFQIFKKRYAAESNPLLCDAKRDAGFLLVAAGDANNADSAWTGADRVDLAERAFPLLFKDNEDLQTIARALLERVLPQKGHPKWSAPQSEWYAWWLKNKDAVRGK